MFQNLSCIMNFYFILKFIKWIIVNGYKINVIKLKIRESLWYFVFYEISSIFNQFLNFRVHFRIIIFIFVTFSLIIFFETEIGFNITDNIKTFFFLFYNWIVKPCIVSTTRFHLNSTQSEMLVGLGWYLIFFVSGRIINLWFEFRLSLGLCLTPVRFSLRDIFKRV